MAGLCIWASRCIQFHARNLTGIAIKLFDVITNCGVSDHASGVYR
jgi:hypothetical protein